MKEARGIKAFCIAAIAMNSAFAIFLLLMTYVVFPDNPPKGSDLLIMGGIVLALLICVLYPAQLLFIRRRYYRHHPVTASSRVLLHISRVIQILFTSFVTVVLAFGFIATIDSLQRYGGIRSRSVRRELLIQMILLVYALIGVIINTIIFFKGWRLLKTIGKKKYIDEVMASFD